jgi:holo-[acyl-carrier protein] synthase
MKIIGIGTDIVAIARIEKIWNRFGQAFAKRILTEKELGSLYNSKNLIAFLAKRYAAKEAVAKAVGTGFQPNGLLLTEIGVNNDALGRPYLEYLGRTKVEIERLGINESQISLSDEKEYAIAFVILLGLHKKTPQ